MCFLFILFLNKSYFITQKGYLKLECTASEELNTRNHKACFAFEKQGGRQHIFNLVTVDSDSLLWGADLYFFFFLNTSGRWQRSTN